MNNGNNIVGDAANEPSIAVDPTDGNKMTIGWRQFNSVSSNFRQGGWGLHHRRWHHVDVSRCIGKQRFPQRSSVDSRMRPEIFSISAFASRFMTTFGARQTAPQSWTRLTFGDVTGGDKQWFTIDTTSGMGHGFLYQAWSTGGNNWGGRQFSRSTDGGVTWMSPIIIPNSPVWGTLDVATNGNLFVGGASNFSSPFWCLRSSNAQNPGVIHQLLIK